MGTHAAGSRAATRGSSPAGLQQGSNWGRNSVGTDLWLNSTLACHARTHLLDFHSHSRPSIWLTRDQPPTRVSTASGTPPVPDIDGRCSTTNSTLSFLLLFFFFFHYLRGRKDINKNNKLEVTNLFSDFPFKKKKKNLFYIRTYI